MIQREQEPLAEKQLARLEELLTQASVPIVDNAPLLAALLSLPRVDRYPPMSWSPQRQKDKTIEALVALLVGLSQQAPVVGIVEDVHWMDPTSLETLDRMVERAQDARVLLVITTRPEFASPWGDHTHVITHTLNRLSRRQVMAMVEQVAGEKPLPREVVVHHYTEAGDYARAIPYWQRAGHQAAVRSAHVEAISHLTMGLEVLSMLPDSPTRAGDELELQRALGASLIATRGFAAAEVEQTYARAQSLCRQVHDTQQLFPVLFGLWGFYDTRGNLQRAREVAEQLIALAQPENDPALLVPGYRALDETFFHLGELVQACTHLERGLSLYDPQQHRTHALLYGHDAGVSCLGFVARTWWLLGYPDQALQRSREAVTLAQTLSHPFSLAFALILLIHLHHHRREAEMVMTHTERLITLSTEQGFPQGVARGMWSRGWALTVQGHLTEGITQLRQGIVAYQSAGFQVSQPYQLAVLAAALGKTGEAEEGLHMLAEARALVEHSGLRSYEAELYRIQGELLQCVEGGVRHAKGMPEACFHRALDIARRQQAKSLELRAAMGLSRLWGQQGKRAEAHALLAPMYGWFTEGFDTADLQEAKMLLEALDRST